MSRTSLIWLQPSSLRNFIGLEYIFHQKIMANQIGTNDRDTSDWTAPSEPHDGFGTRSMQNHGSGPDLDVIAVHDQNRSCGVYEATTAAATKTSHQNTALQ